MDCCASRLVLMGMGTCDALLCQFHALQSALGRGHQAMIVQIDFSSVFNTVNSDRILHMLCSLGIGGYVLSILTQFLINLSQHVMMDGCLSILVNVFNKFYL